jgi:hypothetical protein
MFCCVSGIETDGFTYGNPNRLLTILEAELKEVAREMTAESRAPVTRRQGLLVRFLLGADMSA